jgi:hypothetical protein
MLLLSPFLWIVVIIAILKLSGFIPVFIMVFIIILINGTSALSSNYLTMSVVILS